MVCKEDVLLWFKNLESYKRIDVLYELLNMCIPFELRFIGSCIEEIGKATYQELRGPDISANDLEKLSKDATFTQNLLDESVRHRLILYLSLLSSRNSKVAQWLYKNVLRTDLLEEYVVRGDLKDDTVQSEFLLLYIMALRHPAFTFEQKSHFRTVLEQLVGLKENKSEISPKPSIYGYPPGLGYPTIKNADIPEIPIVPVKSSVTMTCGKDTLHQQPPGLPQVHQPQQSQEFVLWSRPGFPCGTLEVRPPFSVPAVSPLVSESASPSHSRSSSPHRQVVGLRPGAAQPPPPMENMPHMAPIEMLSSNNFQFMSPSDNMKIPEEELNSIPEEKLIPGPPCQMMEPRQPNGIRFPPHQKGHRLLNDFQCLSLDGDSSLRRSNSSSSSCSNQSPPNTPSATPTGTSRVNGIHPFIAPGLTLCDTSSPPPPTFNSSVPYTTYSSTFLPAPGVYPYRPPFSQYPCFQTNENSFQPTYTHLPYIYSQFPPRTRNCYNCGAIGHMGSDCAAKNVDDITQNKTYTIDFSPPPVPEGDK